MAALDTTRPMAATGSARRISGMFVAAFSGFSAWDDARKTRQSLEALTDRELDDIGLSRRDIDRVARR